MEEYEAIPQEPDVSFEIEDTEILGPEIHELEEVDIPDEYEKQMGKITVAPPDEEEKPREIFNLHRIHTEVKKSETEIHDEKHDAKHVDTCESSHMRNDVYPICKRYEMRVIKDENVDYSNLECACIGHYNLQYTVYELYRDNECIISLTIKNSQFVKNPEIFVLHVFRHEVAKREKVPYETLTGFDVTATPPWDRKIPARQIDTLSLTYTASSLDEDGYAQRFSEECIEWLCYDMMRREWVAWNGERWEPAGDRLTKAQEFVADSLFVEICVWMLELEKLRKDESPDARRRAKMINELLKAYWIHIELIHQKRSLIAMVRLAAMRGLKLRG